MLQIRLVYPWKYLHYMDLFCVSSIVLSIRNWLGRSLCDQKITGSNPALCQLSKDSMRLRQSFGTTYRYLHKCHCVRMGSWEENVTLQCLIVHAIVQCSIYKSGAVSNDQRGNHCWEMLRLELDSKRLSSLPYTNNVINSVTRVM